MSRQVDIKISGRKINGYPTVHYKSKEKLKVNLKMNFKKCYGLKI